MSNKLAWTFFPYFHHPLLPRLSSLAASDLHCSSTRIGDRITSIMLAKAWIPSLAFSVPRIRIFGPLFLLWYEPEKIILLDSIFQACQGTMHYCKAKRRQGPISLSLSLSHPQPSRPSICAATPFEYHQDHPTSSTNDTVTESTTFHNSTKHPKSSSHHDRNLRPTNMLKSILIPLGIHLPAQRRG